MDDFLRLFVTDMKRDLIINTNRNFEDWGALFGDKEIASAIIDRIVHHAVIVKVTGTCYRVKNLAEVHYLYKKEEIQHTKGERTKKKDEQSTGIKL